MHGSSSTRPISFQYQDQEPIMLSPFLAICVFVPLQRSRLTSCIPCIASSTLMHCCFSYDTCPAGLLFDPVHIHNSSVISLFEIIVVHNHGIRSAHYIQVIMNHTRQRYVTQRHSLLLHHVRHYNRFNQPRRPEVSASNHRVAMSSLFE